MDNELVAKREKFILKENEKHTLTFYWKGIDEIKNLNIYPLFLKNYILQLPQVIKHVVEIKT